MSKRHTTPKRKKDTPTTTRKHRFYFSNVVAKTGEKSFTNEAAAHTWAKETGVDTSKKVLYVLQNGKKFQWRATPRQ